MENNTTKKRRWERDVLSGRENRERDNGSEISHLGNKIAIVTQLHAIRSLTTSLFLISSHFLILTLLIILMIGYLSDF